MLTAAFWWQSAGVNILKCDADECNCCTDQIRSKHLDMTSMAWNRLAKRMACLTTFLPIADNVVSEYAIGKRGG